MRWIVALGVALFAAGAQANDVGEIKTARGMAHIERGAERLAVGAGMNVREADVLVTGADGAVGITFLDNSLLSVGPGSRFVIERYSFDSTTHAGRFDSSLSKGTLAVVSGKMVKQSPDAMRVRTPSGVMGVRGTEFVVQVGEPAAK
jgi:hypothetical protein